MESSVEDHLYLLIAFIQLVQTHNDEFYLVHFHDFFDLVSSLVCLVVSVVLIVVLALVSMTTLVTVLPGLDSCWLHRLAPGV